VIRETLISVRKDKSHQFNSFATLGERANRLNLLNIPFHVTYSEDELTRTRVLIYSEEMRKVLDELDAEFPEQVQAERDRKASLGIVETKTFETI
jgi:hypothetical protein